MEPSGLFDGRQTVYLNILARVVVRNHTNFNYTIDMKYLKFFIVIFVTLLTASLAHSKPNQRGVAIVVDVQTNANCRGAIWSYAASIEADGLHPYIIVDKWGVPDSIRATLYSLYQTKNLEGAVFVGDIPIPMIRNGQHLSTAFKMDQKRDWHDSSIPSDRFYDDFDLKFDYIKRDSANTLYYYYNLSPEGAQSVSSDIYSARIKPPFVSGKTKYQLIDDYFAKVVREKKSRRTIKQITYFAGHGNSSNSMVARADERLSLTEQFTNLASGKGNLDFIDFTFDNYVKYRLMAELAREDLDLAVLHHHGSDDAQLLNGTPYTNMTSDWLEMSKKFFRGKIRRSKDTSETKQYYIDNYGVPESWVANAFDPEIMKNDSIADASLDITIKDLYGYKPAARFILLDACFNGSFHLDDYIAGHYIFNPGSTIVVKANSVNTLQDTWTNQLLGILDLGVSMGNWAKEQFTIESHLIGDPTYRYASAREDLEGLNEAIVNKRTDIKYWEKLMNDTNPEARALAIKMLFVNGQINYEQLLEIQTNNASPTIRLMAFYLINKKYNNQIVPSLKAGLYDSYELIRRLAAEKTSANGSLELLNDVMKLRIAPGTSKRVYFQLRGATLVYPKEMSLAAFDAQLKDKEGVWYEQKAKERERIEYSLNGTEKEIHQLLDSSATPKSKRFTITALRNSNNASYLDILFKFMRESQESDLKIALADAFGWYTHSWKKGEIIEFCKEQIEVEKDPQVRYELVRTVSRLAN
ncbi:MAG: HEAT repeat domain-containing protein [Bacteroidales bacterium]